MAIFKLLLMLMSGSNALNIECFGNASTIHVLDSYNNH